MILCCDKDNVKIHNFRIEAGSDHIKPDHLIKTFFIVKEVFFFLILLVVVNQLLDSGLMKQFSKSCLCYSRIIQFKHLSRLAWFNKTKGLIYILFLIVLFSESLPSSSTVSLVPASFVWGSIKNKEIREGSWDSDCSSWDAGE